jgi:Fe-S-cluster containining protein
MTFSPCQLCKGRCCKGHNACSSPDATPGAYSPDYRWVLPAETVAIKNFTKLKHSNFYDCPTDRNELFGFLKTKPNGDCIFLTDEGCAIHPVRPFDCKMYPYDILRKDGTHYLIRFTNVCPKGWEDKNIQKIIETALPNIDIYFLTEDDVVEGTFEIVAEIPPPEMEDDSWRERLNAQYTYTEDGFCDGFPS